MIKSLVRVNIKSYIFSVKDITRNVRQEKSVCGFSLKFWSEWFRTGIGSYFAGVGAVLRNGRDILQHGAQPGLSGVRNESDRLHWHLRHAELLGWNDTKFGVKVAREGKKKKKSEEKRFFGPGAPNQLKDKYYCFPFSNLPHDMT